MSGRLWTVAGFEEGPVLRSLGPLYLAESCPYLIGSRAQAWRRFFRLFGDKDNQKARQKWCKRGYRIVEVQVVVEMVDKVVGCPNE